MNHAFLALALLSSARAVLLADDFKLAGVFTDHAVLQCDAAVPVWGTADAGTEVSVKFAGQEKIATSDANGKWLVKLDPVPVSVEPRELIVTAGKESLKRTDVLVGEVWLASGQSNMRFPLAQAKDGKQDAARADHPQLRYFRVGGAWTSCTPKSSPAFSAVAYYFAIALQQERKVPIGIIENAVSGELGQNFMSPAAFRNDPELAALVQRHTRETSTQWARLVEPVVPYGIKGVLWYQGEGNRDFPATYRRLLPALIADWRGHWGQGDFPFLVVQLANYQERRSEPWEGKDCALRDAQLQTVRTVPNTALIVTIDLGEAKDVHYPDKRPVGERLALAARALAYGEKIEHSGPLFEEVQFADGKAVITFSHLGGGLATSGDPLTGFLLCGPDRRFVRAEARIDGDRVIVSSEKVPNPVAVRYAWERNPACNLSNRAGLPASPFRSDTFINYFTKDGSD